MGPIERRAREREEIRSRILDAAREMFVSEGYEAVTMRRIADRIEYSPTAIYFHFKDKEALLRELCETDFRRLAEVFTSIAKVADPIERLRKAGLAYIDFATKYPNHYRLMFMTPHPPIDPSQIEIAKGNPEEDSYAFVKAIVSDAIAQKRLRRELKDVDLVAQTVWAGVHGVAALHIAKGNDPWCEWKPMKKQSELMVDTLIRGIAAAGGK